jgi:hypothetical protein
MIDLAYSPRRKLWLAILIIGAAGVLVTTGPLAAQQRSKPLTKQEVISLLKGEVSHSRIEDLAREKGIAFQVTPQVERELRAAGADDSLLRALRSASKTSPRESTPPAETPDAADSGGAADSFPAPEIRPGESYFPALGIVTPESQPADYTVIDVLEVAHGSPAETAGLQSACTILTLAGVRVTSPQQLQKVLSQHRAGETVEITFNDGSLVHTARLRLAGNKSSRGDR